jgi:hypothetical protein
METPPVIGCDGDPLGIDVAGQFSDIVYYSSKLVQIALPGALDTGFI